MTTESLNVGRDGRADSLALEPGCVQFTNSDRLFFIQLYRWFPSVLKAITIIHHAFSVVESAASGTGKVELGSRHCGRGCRRR